MRLVIVSLISAAFLLLSCDTPPSERRDSTLKDYVNTPKDTARDVAKDLEGAQNDVYNQQRELFEDEEGEAQE